MALKRLAAFRLDPDLIAGLEQIKQKTGAPVAEQVRRAIRAWLASQGIAEKPERKRAATRKRS
jgi:Ribbon-helix-helix protein, copG family